MSESADRSAASWAKSRTYYVLRFEDGRFYWEHYGSYDNYRVGFTDDFDKAYQTEKPGTLIERVSYYKDFAGLRFNVLRITERTRWQSAVYMQGRALEATLQRWDARD